MAMNFKYKEVIRSNKTHAISPSIPLTFFSKDGGRYDFVVLLDSGADISAIPKHLAELLNLDLSGKTERTFGIGGEARAVETKVNIEIEKNHEKYNLIIPVKVILDDYDFPPLIGRAVFFDNFDIIFKQSQKRVTLKHVVSRAFL